MCRPIMVIRMLIKKHLKQTITYWVRETNDGYGRYTFATPATMKGRWNQKSELFQPPEGQQKVSQAVVWLQNDLSVGDYIYLGTSSEALPYSVSGAYEIKGFSKIPSIRGNESEIKVWL